MTKALGLGDDMGDGGDYGELDIFGLDEFGMPAGLNPLWGAVAGGALSTGAAMATRAFSADWGRWSEGIGAGVGVLAGAAMAFFPGSRAAGWTAIATSLVTSGLRQLESLMTDNFGVYSVERGYPVNGVTVEPLVGAGLGVHMIEPSAQVNGAYPELVGTPYGQAPAELLGALNGLGQEQQMPASLLGLGSHYGSTLFSR